MGALDDTQGHEVLAAARLVAVVAAWLVAAVAGTANSTASATAVNSRPLLHLRQPDKICRTRAPVTTLSSGFGRIPPLWTTQFNKN